MLAIACRRYLLALAALAGVGMPSLFAQEPKQPFVEDYESLAIKAWTLKIGAGEPIAAFGAHLLASEHPLLKQQLQFPVPQNFWITTPAMEIQAALYIIGAGNGAGKPLAAAGARVLASQETLLRGLLKENPELKKWEFEFDEVIPLDRRHLDRIVDNRPLPEVFRNELTGPDLAWYLVYNEALERSHLADLDMFKKSAVRHENVTYPRLKAMPAAFRGEIITVTGKLVLVRDAEKPRLVRLDHLPKIYTGYINGPTKGAPPIAIAFTDLPDEIKKPSENIDLQVTFHGYFLSLISFAPEKKGQKEQKNVVYLVGKTVIVLPGNKAGGVPAEQDDGLPNNFYLVAAALGGIVGIAIFVALLNLWFRRGDRRIQDQLRATREKNVAFDLEPADFPPAAEPLPTPEAETGIKPADDNEQRPPGSGGL